MKLDAKQVGEFIKAEFVEETLEGTSTEKLQKIVKKLERDNGFTEFHLAIQKEIRGLTKNGRDWERVSAHIKGNEGIWLTAIYLYLK